MHRTLDLEIHFSFLNAGSRQERTRNEKISFQQSYVGEAEILVPPADSEMMRLGRLLCSVCWID